ncbi:MAG: NAD(P)/FAD-dependent oxidoreductase [Proteobacteria bacterium]|nr:NAD(P)/FAD-dependent oxidoreductase [Pseudomonadota bacterium]
MIDSARFVIIGAGPTGSALATYLAKAGEDVLLVDMGAQPQIGESLVPLCAPIFEELGVSMEGFVVKYGAVFEQGEDSVRFDFRDAVRDTWPNAWQCRRAVLDPRMRAAAIDAGARIREARVRRVIFGDRQTVVTDQGEIDCERVIDASGRNQLLGRQLGLTVQHETLRNASQGAWFSGVATNDLEEPGDVTIAVFDTGWFWFIPLGDGVTSVGVTVQPDGPRGDWDEALRRCPRAAERLKNATALQDLQGAADFTVRATRFHGPGWALAGDAATFLDPVFSTGIVLGLWGAKWLSAALLGHDSLDAYQAKVEAAVAAFEPVVHDFYSGDFLAVAFSEQAQKNEGVRKAVVSLLAADVFDPEFTAPRRMGSRIAQLAARVRR